MIKVGLFVFLEPFCAHPRTSERGDKREESTAPIIVHFKNCLQLSGEYDKEVR